VAGRVASLAVLPRGVLCVFDNGSVYSFTADSPGPNSECSLPDHGLPIDLFPDGDRIYALVRGDVARKMPPGGDPSRWAGVFGPEGAAICLAQLERSTWSAIAPCPAIINADVVGMLRPRLGRVDDQLVVLWKTAADQLQIMYRPLQERGKDWMVGREFSI